MVNDTTVVDLFCGCGGLSLGGARSGFHSIAAIDVDPTLQSAYRRNFPKTNAVQANVEDIDGTGWQQLIGRARPDAVVGGPPCQGFSWMGKRNIDDPRNTLIDHFFRQVATLNPKFFLMENVQGLLSEKSVFFLESALERVRGRYTVLKPLIVNAAHFGAATNRIRVIVFGYDPSRVDAVKTEDLLPEKPMRLTTVRDAIADLPSPIAENKKKHDFGWAKYQNIVDNMSSYARLMRREENSHIGDGEAIKMHRQGLVSGMFETKHSEKVATRYGQVRPGKSDSVSKSYRLSWEGLCPTLRAGTGSDKGSFQAVRPLHPEHGRVITVREAARLQGFPDWFVFHPTKWHSFRMIGNSVSPLVSFGLMSRIRLKIANALAA